MVAGYYSSHNDQYSSKKSKAKTYEKSEIFHPIVFSPEAWQVVWTMTHECPIEWSCMGSLEIRRNSSGQIEDYYVEKVWIPKQSCTSGHTDMDDLDLARCLLEADDEGFGGLKTWIHSHAQMGVFWSGTDDSTIDKLCRDVLVSVVVNRAGDMLGRVDIHDPVRAKFDDVPIEVDWGEISIGAFGPQPEEGNRPLLGWANLSDLKLNDLKLLAITKDPELDEWCKKTCSEMISKAVVATSYKGGYKVISGPVKNKTVVYKSLEDFEAALKETLGDSFELADDETLTSVLFEEVV